MRYINLQFTYLLDRLEAIFNVDSAVQTTKNFISKTTTNLNLWICCIKSKVLWVFVKNILRSLLSRNFRQREHALYKMHTQPLM